ncbi:GlxA family transcriptional regulator [Belnapia sp. T6]|uniref:GlxA family transcriptional regulator n=1 Tax=Belnapia mucosa TaxID=2804532 RepID=A0ABS1UW63_9PROT|nr:GlxA family transcriptional regulator [Belnapia mucosa]MBL6453714.1 GlxA family transcriptional regulator [Belnapia mucosa]
MSREIRFLIHPGFQLLDLSGPLAAFQIAGRLAGAEPYRLRVVSRGGGPVASSSGVEVLSEPADALPFDTLVVMGGAQGQCSTGESEEARIVAAGAGRSRRTASVCTGAFTLANAGLLDGRRATTHWEFAALLQRLFPRIRVDGDRIFIQDGPIWTSAGITAGIDLALAMIEEDLGMELSRATARMLVVYHRRPGGQSQFSTLLELDPRSERIRAVLSFVREHLHEALTAERLAAIACLSPRQFTRAFLAETGETPARAVERLRAELARQRIEDGSEPIEVIAREVGFLDPERMRRAFLRRFGHPPQSIRRLARTA